MLKIILNLDGVKELNKNDQKAVQGGFGPGFCYMQNSSTCCCFFDDIYPNGDFICANGRPKGPGPLDGCLYG